MKKLTLILFFVPFLCYSQESQEPFKKANTIIIPLEESKQDAYRRIASILAENGYGIDAFDATLGTISTTEKGYKNGTLKLNIFVTDDKIRLNGNFTLDAINMTSRITYKGMKGSPSMNAWEEMQKVATQYNKKVLYALN